MARAKVEQQQPATGMTLIVMVGLAIAFLLFMAFLNVVKSGNILNETNFLFAALIFYAGAVCLVLHRARTDRQYRRHRPSLVRIRACAVFQCL